MEAESQKGIVKMKPLIKKMISKKHTVGVKCANLILEKQVKSFLDCYN